MKTMKKMGRNYWLLMGLGLGLFVLVGLTGPYDIIKARSSAGLKLFDDGGNGLTIADGGGVTASSTFRGEGNLTWINNSTGAVRHFFENSEGTAELRYDGDLFGITGASLGIGTNAPSTVLHVLGQTTLDGVVSIGDGTVATEYIQFAGSRGSVGILSGVDTILQSGAGKNVEIRTNNNTFGSGTLAAEFDTSGNTTLSGDLAVNGDATLGDAPGDVVNITGSTVNIGPNTTADPTLNFLGSTNDGSIRWDDSDGKFVMTGDFEIIGDTTLESLFVSGGNTFRIATHTPASASATGDAGTIAWDSSYIYVCVATDTWKRVAISTW